MAFQKVKEFTGFYYEKDGNMARITLNRPERLNILDISSGGMTEQLLRDGLDEACKDDEIKVLIFRGAGSAFCAGADMRQLGFHFGLGTGQAGERRPSERARLNGDREIMMQFMNVLTLPKITVASIHGYALEGGFYLAMFSDYTIAAENTILGMPAQRVGFAGCSSPMVWFLMQSLGYKKARELIVTGKRIDAEEAHHLGLVAKVVPEDKLEEETLKVAKAFCQYPADGIAIGKHTNNIYLELLGITQGFNIGTYSHSLFTNLRFEPGEFNFFRSRRNEGMTATLHDRDTLFEEAFESPEVVQLVKQRRGHKAKKE